MENKVIAINNPRFPGLLKQIGNHAPKQLYYKGNWSPEIFENCLAVVGSRRATTYSKIAVKTLVAGIASQGITIVSGFMYGIDAMSHKAALEVNGRTIAVMPCGIDLIHPYYQDRLYKEVLESKGLIVSEYANSFPPDVWTYPKRNRIVAGLCRAVLIIEAEEKSGSLITAGFAKKFKRKIFAVPGPINSSFSKGTNGLIKQGAEPVLRVSDILDFFPSIRKKIDFSANCPEKNKQAEPKIKRSGTDSSIERMIIKELQKEPMEADVLSRALNLPISKIGTTLSLMQIKGLLFEESGKYYIK